MRVASGACCWLLWLSVSAVPAQTETSPGEVGSTAPPSSIAGKSLEKWKSELTSVDASRRSMAILAIVQFGDVARESVSLILERCNDTDVSPRTKAIMALRTIAIDEKDVPKAVATLARHIDPAQESQSMVRYEAMVSLQRFTEDAGPAIPSLIRATTDKASWELRHMCVSILWRTALSNKEPDARVTEALLNILRWDRTYMVKIEALQGLAALGRPPTPQLYERVINDLNLCARHQHKPLAIWAYVGLVMMQEGPSSEVALVALSRFLKHPDLEVRTQAAQALGALGSKAKSKIPALLEMLKDTDANAVYGACVALGMINEKNDQIIDALLEVAHDTDKTKAVSAVSALVTLKANTSKVTGTLEKMLENPKLNIQIRGVIENSIKELRKPPAKKK